MKIEWIFIIVSCVLSCIPFIINRKKIEHNLLIKNEPGYIFRVIIMYIMIAIICWCILNSVYMIITGIFLDL